MARGTPTQSGSAAGSDHAANHGQSSHGLRGNYERMRADYTVDQDYAAYGADDQDRWRRLYKRQIDLVPGRACDEYIDTLNGLDYAGGVPRFETVTAKLEAATGWRLVAVPGLVPDLVFFDHLANRRFPVTCWLRDEHEFEYIVEPDIFHDFFGHVPMLFTPVFADYMEAYGKGGLKAEGLGSLKWLARLYWYTVEFGLIRTKEGLRSYGAGILSSPSEVDYAIRSPEPRRVGFDLKRIMRSLYRIDAFQETYFVIDDFSQLFEATAPEKFFRSFPILGHAVDVRSGGVEDRTRDIRARRLGQAQTALDIVDALVDLAL